MAQDLDTSVISTRTREDIWKRWIEPSWRLVTSVVVTLFGLLALTFFIGRLLPIDPVIAIIGDQADQATYDVVYKKLGLDQPLYVQFYRYIVAVLQFDFGTAIFSGKLVIEDIKRVFPATIELATIGLLFGAMVGVPAGVYAAVYRHKFLDHAVRVLGLIGYSAPIFWLGLLGLMIFYGWLGWVGGPGRVDTYYIGVVDFVTGSILIDAALANEWDIFWNAVSLSSCSCPYRSPSSVRCGSTHWARISAISRMVPCAFNTRICRTGTLSRKLSTQKGVKYMRGRTVCSLDTRTAKATDLSPTFSRLLMARTLLQ